MRFTLWINRRASRTLDQVESGKIYFARNFTNPSHCCLNLMRSFGQEIKRACDFFFSLKIRRISFIDVCQVKTEE